MASSGWLFFMATLLPVKTDFLFKIKILLYISIMSLWKTCLNCSYFKSGKQDVHPPFYKPETPCGGIYMLPPFQENGPLGEGMPGEERAVVAVESLGETPAVTKCPSCQEVVFTETRKRVGETMWLICCLCSLIGCVAGCCVIPFFVDRLRNVQHQCPHCQAQIRTHRPVWHAGYYINKPWCDLYITITWLLCMCDHFLGSVWDSAVAVLFFFFLLQCYIKETFWFWFSSGQRVVLLLTPEYLHNMDGIQALCARCKYCYSKHCSLPMLNNI